MAPRKRKQSRLLEDPPSASPSEEHEEEEVEEQEEEEAEEVNELTQKTSQISKLSQMSQKKAGGESSEEEEEEEEASETENDDTKHSPTASSFIIKRTVHKNNHSMNPTKPTAKKRVLISDEGRKDSPKKTKVAKDHSQEDRLETPNKVGASGGRVWNPDDVISILGGIIDYQKQGSDPHADMGAFLEFVKGRFGFEVTRNQLYEKVRSLKRKFFATLGKGESGISTKPHEIECFELSKKIWGGNNGSGNNGSVGNTGSNGNGRVVANGVDHTEHVKVVDGERVTRKSAKGKSSEGKRKEKVEKKKKKKKKVRDKKNKKKMANGSTVAEKELKSLTDEDENIVQKEAEPVTDDDVRKDIEDVVKAYENSVEEEAEPVSDEDVMKDKEAAMKCDKNFASDDEILDEDTAQNLSLKYPYLTVTLCVDMPESRKTPMMEGIHLLGSEKLIELDDSLKEQRMKEAEIFCRKTELKAEQLRLLMDKLKGTGKVCY